MFFVGQEVVINNESTRAIVLEKRRIAGEFHYRVSGFLSEEWFPESVLCKVSEV